MPEVGNSFTLMQKKYISTSPAKKFGMADPINDSPEEMEAMCQWLSAISPEIPLHLSRFFPAYKMLNKPPTPVHTLTSLEQIARRYLRHVHLGNV